MRPGASKGLKMFQCLEHLLSILGVELGGKTSHSTCRWVEPEDEACDSEWVGARLGEQFIISLHALPLGC